MSKEKMSQTKGYALIVGTIHGIDGKEPRKNEWRNELSVRVKTTKENTVFIKVGGFTSSPLAVKLKPQGMETADEIPMGEVADVLADYFKDGDSVLVRCSVDINCYKEGRLDLVANGIYACKEEIDFDSKDFEERNEVTIPMVVTSKFNGNSLVARFVNYKGDTTDKILEAEYEPIKEYLKGAEVGDLIPIMMSFVSKPIYEEGDKKEEKSTTLMGRKLGKSTKKIVGSDNKMVIIDIDVDKVVKGKYKLEEEEEVEDDDMPF